MDKHIFKESQSWTLWLDKAEKRASVSEYTAALRKIFTMSSMSSLTTVCAQISPGVELNNRFSYHFMLGSRRPVWEDKENCNGGTWTFRCSKADTEVVWRTLFSGMVSGSMKSSIHPSIVFISIFIIMTF